MVYLYIHLLQTNRHRSGRVIHRTKSPKSLRLWITQWTMWIKCRAKCGQKACIPCIKTIRSHRRHTLATVRPRSRRPATPARPFAPPPSRRGAFFWFRPFLSRKKRTKRKSTDNEGAGAQARSLFSFPLRFLFFGSFFSFPERKERTSSLRPFLSRKKRTKRKSTDKKGAGVLARPCFLYPLRFLFFGSFFSFPERKERTSSLRPFLSGKKRTKRKSTK